MIRWRKAWYPQAPVYPVSLKPGGDWDAMSGLQRMSDEQIAMMQMVGTPPASGEQVDWFLGGMLYHHGGALEMAHEALDRSFNTTIRRLSRDIILAQRQEIILLRKMLASRGLSKPSYYNYDHIPPPDDSSWRSVLWIALLGCRLSWSGYECPSP